MAREDGSIEGEDNSIGTYTSSNEKYTKGNKGKEKDAMRMLMLTSGYALSPV